MLLYTSPCECPFNVPLSGETFSSGPYRQLLKVPHPGVNLVFIIRSSFESLIQLINYSSFKNFQNFQKTSSFVKKDSVFLFRPVNFLGGRHNRFTIAATFGATASTCMELFFSGKSGIFIEGGPPWVKGKYGTSQPDP